MFLNLCFRLKARNFPEKNPWDNFTSTIFHEEHLPFIETCRFWFLKKSVKVLLYVKCSTIFQEMGTSDRHFQKSQIIRCLDFHVNMYHNVQAATKWHYMHNGIVSFIKQSVKGVLSHDLLKIPSKNVLIIRLVSQKSETNQFSKNSDPLWYI